MIYFFTWSEEGLIAISNGIQASHLMQKDLLKAKRSDEEANKLYCNERLFNENK